MSDAAAGIHVDRAGPEPDGPVVTVTLDRPDALNALTPGMLDALGDRLDEIAGDATARVVVVTGAGRAFSAGVDLKALGQVSLEGGAVGDLLDVPARRVTALLATMPQITVAKVNGFCFTGALELALACDLMVVAEEAKLADTHAKFGLRPSWGMSQRLLRAVGPARARELSYTARTFTGVDAAAWGLAVRAVPLAELDGAVDELVTAIVASSGEALAAAKDLYRAGLDHGLADGLGYEAATAYVITDTEARVGSFR
jgi:enoyl-CoA hydratase/carnithine racemase